MHQLHHNVILPLPRSSIWFTPESGNSSYKCINTTEITKCLASINAEVDLLKRFLKVGANLESLKDPKKLQEVVMEYNAQRQAQQAQQQQVQQQEQQQQAQQQERQHAQQQERQQAQQQEQRQQAQQQERQQGEDGEEAEFSDTVAPRKRQIDPPPRSGKQPRINNSDSGTSADEGEEDRNSAPSAPSAPAKGAWVEVDDFLTATGISSHSQGKVATALIASARHLGCKEVSADCLMLFYLLSAT